MLTPSPEQQRIIKAHIEYEFKNRLKIYSKKHHSDDYIINYVTDQNHHFDYYILVLEYIPEYRENFYDQNLISQAGATMDLIVHDFINKTNYYSHLYKESYKEEYILRFSKTYGNIEYYNTRTYFSHFKKRKDEGLKTVVHKKNVIYKVRPNGHCLIAGGKRYISLKNFNSVEFNKILSVELLNNHIKGNFKFDELHQYDKIIFNIPNSLSRGQSCILDIVKKVARKPIPKVLTDKFDHYTLYNLYSVIPENDLCKIINHVREHKDVYGDHKKKIKALPIFNNSHFHKPFLKIIGELMALKLKLTEKLISSCGECAIFAEIKGTHREEQFLIDYINTCYILKEKINLNITSTKRLRFLHDQVAIKQRSKGIPKIQVHKDFPELQITAADLLHEFNWNIEKISDSKRLVTESVKMNHCVSSYFPQINKGNSCIYHINDLNTGEKATLEVGRTIIGKDEKKKDIVSFTSKQLQGIWNTCPSNTFIEKLNLILQKNSISLLNTANGRIDIRNILPAGGAFEYIEDFPF